VGARTPRGIGSWGHLPAHYEVWGSGSSQSFWLVVAAMWSFAVSTAATYSLYSYYNVDIIVVHDSTPLRISTQLIAGTGNRELAAAE